jgi:Fe2+ transport system protein FeoA
VKYLLFKIKINEGSELKIQQKALLKGEISVVLEIRVPALWMPEPFDDVNGSNGVRNRLLGFGFYVLSHMQVVTNCSCYAGQFLQCIALSNQARRDLADGTNFAEISDGFAAFCRFFA